jgi:DNA-binding transcriptional ArsR family regulator
MHHRTETNPSSSRAAAQRIALSSAFRVEILGLFGGDEVLSVSDMARLTGRPATSLYHHVGVLEDAGILEAAGTRPKGKRFEKLYRAADAVVELEYDCEDEAARAQVAQTIAAAFRMAERDFNAALERDDLLVEGPLRNSLSFRVHMRASPDFIGELNERLDAITELITGQIGRPCEPNSRDQFLSLTLALLPLRGRRVSDTQPPEKETDS